LMMEAIRSSETSVLTRATRGNNPEDDILHSHRCETLKSYMELFPFPRDVWETPTALVPLERADLSHRTIWNSRRWTKSGEPVILTGIHHRQNPFHSRGVTVWDTVFSSLSCVWQTHSHTLHTRPSQAEALDPTNIVLRPQLKTTGGDVTSCYVGSRRDMAYIILYWSSSVCDAYVTHPPALPTTMQLLFLMLTSLGYFAFSRRGLLLPFWSQLRLPTLPLEAIGDLPPSGMLRRVTVVRTDVSE
jgi:hypothetical protein